MYERLEETVRPRRIASELHENLGRSCQTQGQLDEPSRWAGVASRRRVLLGGLLADRAAAWSASSSGLALGEHPVAVGGGRDALQPIAQSTAPSTARGRP